MPNNYFHFKEFSIFQNHAAFRVGTDGVLLGSWVNIFDSKRILDVGTGTGLLALMCAQRNLQARIVGIDISEAAITDASSNFQLSIWKERLLSKNISFQEFANSASEKIDHIISNPPYFSNSLKNNHLDLRNSRHNDELSFEDFMDSSLKIISENGKISIILPEKEGQIFIDLAEKRNLFLNRICSVKPLPNKPINRLLMEFSLNKSNNLEEDSFSVELERHQYTEEYKDLTKDFLL